MYITDTIDTLEHSIIIYASDDNVTIVLTYDMLELV